ncbi:MAG: YafY family protein [Niabella sp.]
MGNEDAKRLNRLTTILIQLQSRRVIKAQDIAARFNISLRTVYRDIKALEDAGIPLIGESGKGYSIMEGYRLPPVMFTSDEALAFLTAEKIISKFTDVQTTEHYNAAMYKIRSVLRYAEKEKMEKLEDHITVLENAYLPASSGNELHIQSLLKAIANALVIEIGYTNAQEATYTNRKLEPVGIFRQGNYWYLVAYCYLRSDYRTFRTDRISYLRTSNEHYRHTHPSLQSFIDKMQQQKELQKIVISVELPVLKYLGDQKYYNGFVSQEIKKDSAILTFLAASLIGFSKFYLLFAEYAEIIEPLALKAIITDQLNAIQKKLN